MTEKHQQDDPMIVTILRQLDNGSRNLDAATCSRLNRARQAAVQQLQSGRAWRRFGLPMALATTAAAAALAVALWTGTPSAVAPEVIDMELLASGDSFEFFEDLEFYRWLDGELDQG